ncbi:hypothetical protein ACIBO5_57890 [Nonomuraea angiospora]
MYEGVVPSATGEPTGVGRLGDNVGGQGLAWKRADVAGPAGGLEQRVKR